MVRWLFIYALIVPATVFSNWLFVLIEVSVGPGGL